MENTNGTGKTNESNNTLPSRVGVIYSDVKREYFPTEEQYITEKDAEHDAKLVATYIEKLGIHASIYPADENLVESLKSDKPEMVFNLVDSIKGYEYLSSSIPGVCELLNIPYTGADILGLALTYNKFLVKKLLQQAKVPVPNFQLFYSANDPLEINLRFPLISKLNEIHGAVEITKDSVSETEKHLRERLKYLIETYKQPVLVEEFIVGREVTAIVLEGLNRKVYLAEKIFDARTDKYVFLTFEDTWLKDDAHFHYEKCDDLLLKEYVKSAFEVAKLMDYAKLDVRIDSSGRYYFIDINANPAFGPNEAGTAIGYILEDLYKIPFMDILQRLILNTLRSPTQDYNGADNGNAVLTTNSEGQKVTSINS